MNFSSCDRISQKDIEAIAASLNQMWGPQCSETDSSSFKKAAAFFGKAYLYHNLSQCSIVRVFHADKKTAGIFCVRLLDAKSFHPLYRIKSIFYLLPMLLNKRTRIYLGGWKKYYRNCHLQEKKLPSFYRAELKLLFTLQDFRGQGLGKIMLSEMKTLLKEKNGASYFLHTDTECNYKFYDASGLVLLDKLSFGIPSDPNYCKYMYGEAPL